MSGRLSCLEICAGAGGQSLGLEMAGFAHELAVEIEPEPCQTLRINRPHWKVHEGDVREIDGRPYHGIDLLAGGVPCPPFSIAGKRVGEDDERDLFPEALRLVGEARPTAVMLENVRGLSTAKFEPYRRSIQERLANLGYHSDWQVLNASEFGVPQLRPRFIVVAVKRKYFRQFRWPEVRETPPTVGDVLYPLMACQGWPGAASWAKRANGIGPTIVGGSRKHGGPDIGPLVPAPPGLNLEWTEKVSRMSALTRSHHCTTHRDLHWKWLRPYRASRPTGNFMGARQLPTVRLAMLSRHRLLTPSEK
jgi:DNA (cytosine-5)-methyltransferase 1